MVKLSLEKMFVFLHSGRQTERPVRPAGIENHVGIEFPAHVSFLEKIHHQEKPFIPEGLDAAVQFRIDKENFVLLEIYIRLYIPVTFEEQLKIPACGRCREYQ